MKDGFVLVALVVCATAVMCSVIWQNDDHDYTLWARDCVAACGDRGVFTMTTTSCECRSR